MKYELVSHHKTATGWWLKVKETPNWWERLFSCPEMTVQYVGECTVWMEYPSCERVSTWKEAILCDMWQKIQIEINTHGDIFDGL